MSSVDSIKKVKRGGIKKKSQISALNKAANKTGKISKSMAMILTVTNKTNAVTLYPIKSDKAKQMADINSTRPRTMKYCFAFVVVLEMKGFTLFNLQQQRYTP